MVENPSASAGDMSSTPGSGKSSGEENGNPLLYSCLENPMNRGAWWATVHGVAKESDMTERLNSGSSNSIGYHKPTGCCGECPPNHDVPFQGTDHPCTANNPVSCSVSLSPQDFINLFKF